MCTCVFCMEQHGRFSPMEEQPEYGPVLMGKESLSPALPTCSLVFPTSWPRTGSARKPWLLSHCQVPFITSSRRMGCSWRAECQPNHFIPQRPSSGLLCTSIFFFSVDSFPWVRGLSTRNTLTALLGQYLPNYCFLFTSDTLHEHLELPEGLSN